ncbi:chemotaxis signal transduction protein [Agrobacterium tumefaciens]|nr:chemotaxis signal transduction protein [Agrobacterium radiobacter]MBB4453588.1 chemotaxis signal transduction protein [Agrobacterium radiobacter]
MAMINSTNFGGETLEIIALRLHDQEFCVKTTTIREIRGWAPSTPIPHAPKDVIGVMNLRGSVIPIIDLAHKLGMKSTVANERAPSWWRKCTTWSSACWSTAFPTF